MRSNDGAASPETLEAAQTPDIPGKPSAGPPMVFVAAIVLAAEAVALLVATVLNVADIATGHSYQVGNGVALVILQVIVIAGLIWIASSMAKLRPWTRTPAVMVQVLIGIVAIVLLQAHRYDWGLATLVLAAAGLVALLNPASLRALERPRPETEPGHAQHQPQKPVKPQKPATPTSSARSGNPAKRNPGSASATSGKQVSRRS